MTVITAADVEKANGLLVIAIKDVITPLAADRAKELGVKIERSAQASARFSAGSAHRRRGEANVADWPGRRRPANRQR